MKKNNKSEKIPVAIVMGSESDKNTMKEAAKALKKFNIPFQMSVISAHRTPNEVARFAKDARRSGFQVIIAGAGGAAHLPGMIASYTELPVIGVPIPIGLLHGQDALLSIVQMPKGIPVATVAIGNAWNAGILAVQILGLQPWMPKTPHKMLDTIKKYKEELRKKVLSSSPRPL